MTYQQTHDEQMAFLASFLDDQDEIDTIAFLKSFLDYEPF